MDEATINVDWILYCHIYCPETYNTFRTGNYVEKQKLLLIRNDAEQQIKGGLGIKVL